MKQRIATLVTVTALALLACAPAAFADGNGDESTNHLAIFLAVLVVIASAVVMQLTNRHFNKKRQANQRKNRQRSKKKRR